MKTFLNISFFILLGFGICFGQTGKVSGRLIMENMGEAHLVIGKTMITLVDGGHERSMVIDKNLAFHFDSIKNDTIKLYFTPPSYLENYTYRIRLAEIENQIIELPYFPTCKYSKSENNRTCPRCKKKSKVIPIYYGLIVQIGKKKRKSKFKSGGCIVSDCQPNWYCERDGNEF